MDITVRYYPVSLVDCIKVHRMFVSKSYDSPSSLKDAKDFMDNHSHLNTLDIEYSNVNPLVVERLKDRGLLRDRPHMLILQEDELELIKMFKAFYDNDVLFDHKYLSLIRPRILKVDRVDSTVSFHVRQYTMDCDNALYESTETHQTGKFDGHY